jgi:lysozyme
MSNAPKCGIDLIKEFESCHLTAYPDPKTKGRPYTIGWGSTRKRDGSPFYLGEKITQKEADDLFDYQIETEFLPAIIKIPGYSSMTEEQIGALLSFAYNLGAGFYNSNGFETITRRLKNREWELVPQALSLYVNPGSNVEAGLRRRRKREGDLWIQGLKRKSMEKQQIIAVKDTVLKKQPLQSYQLTYDQVKKVPAGKGYQVVDIVSEGTHSKVTLDYGAGVWYIYNPHWEIEGVDGPSIQTPQSKILKVKYFPQRDSATTHAHRMCFSSSCAMAADYVNPKAIDVAEQEDDYYMKNYVFRHGDTTIAANQIKALADLKIKATFRQNLSHDDIISQINKNFPVPAALLIHGYINVPTGGGHWICIIGYDNNSKQYIVHDPYGELDLVHGGYYGSTNGANMRYSYEKLRKRFEVDSSGRFAPGHGWGIIIER